MRSKSLCTLIALFILPSIAQPRNGEPIADLRLENYLTTFDRIPSPSFGRVSCIHRDRRGFLWFGTTRGLCRYDGYAAKVFSNGPLLNMDQQVVSSIMELDDRRLLLGTLEGLWTFDLDKEQFTRFSLDPGLFGTGIADLARSGSNIIIATNSEGLVSYNPSTGSLQTCSTGNGLMDKRITCLFLDQLGTLWVGTLAGLHALDVPTLRVTNTYTVGSENSSLSSGHITALCRNARGELWIGTDEGVHVLQPQSGRMHPVAIQSPIKHTIWSITEDRSGNMWVAASELGLLAYSNGQLCRFMTLHDTDRSLHTIRVLYSDPVASTETELLLWIGTRTGINKVTISRNPFTSHIRGQNSLQLNRGAVLSLYEDHTGTLWVGLWGGGLNGLRRVNGTYRRAFNFEKHSSAALSLPHNDVGSVFEDSKGRLWAGTPDGLALFSNQRQPVAIFRHTKGDSTSILDDNIVSILEDHSGTIWVSTHQGLSALPPNEEKRFMNYPWTPGDSDPPGGNTISGLLADHQSNLWIGTYGKGLVKRQPDGVVTSYTYAEDTSGIRENWIYKVVGGRDGNIWLSTRSGLVSFEPQTGHFEPYPIEQLNDAPIFGIFENRRGDLWLSTSIGLAKFNPVVRSFERFDDTQGIPFRELRCGFHLNSRGKILVGGLDGFVEFDPDSVFPPSTPPEIVVTSFSIFGTELPWSVLAAKQIRLSHDQNFFSFSFAALDYVNSKQNRFAYMMEGVDRDWIHAGTRNYASYTHLDPGEYRFRVKGSNSKNVWNEAGTSLSIIITPPYWRTGWFQVCIAFAAIAGAYAAYRYKLKKALEVERMRLRIADDLHDDVGSNLSSIAMVSRVVQRAPELSSATREKLNEIYDTAIKTSEGMKDIVWFIKPKADTVDDLLLRMKDTASSLLADISHDFHAVSKESPDLVTIDFKRNFYLAFKEILTNIIRHASATNVVIQVEQKGEFLQATVNDDGVGFDEQQVQGGNGLSSLQNRARALGGLCEIHSIPGQGTSVRFFGKL